MKMNYKEFLNAKKHTSIDMGIESKFIPDKMFDFQKYVTEYAVKKGRCAVFLDTGLGKTIIELATAVNYIRYTNKPVLIITPLAVAFQFIKEAEKFGIDDISYSKDGKFKTKIVVCNYERLDKFNPDDFDCTILDESSILKNFDGAIKSQVTTFMKKMKYRYLFTATPSPNDFVELGTSSEALGYMGYTDMLTKFFTNNEDTIKPQNIGTQWILKGHAKESFFEWVSSWSISMRKPSDLGFSDDKHVLPQLILNYHSVKNEKPLVVNGQGQLFNIVAKNFQEIRSEVNGTLYQRCEKAAELTDSHDVSFVWCNKNDEAGLLNQLIPNSLEISGKDSMDKKEDAILWFLGEKCLCNNKNFSNFTHKLANNKLCGKENTQKIEEENITNHKKKGTEESRRVELLMKIRNICQNITKVISQNSTLTTNREKKKIENAENVMLMIKNIEKNVNQKQDKTILQIKDLRELLNNTVLLVNSKEQIRRRDMNLYPTNAVLLMRVKDYAERDPARATAR